MADMMYGATATSGDLSEENNTDFYGGIGNTNVRQRFPGLYVGNLTWWTTDSDVINAINSVGIQDVQEVKFFENRNNGQSKGFCVVTFNSEASLPAVMEKLPKLELYGQNPVVTPYNRQNLSLFESQTKTRPQINSSNGPNSHAAGIMGISSISGVHAGTQGMPYSGLNTYNQGAGGVGGPRTPSYHSNMRFQMRAPRPVMRGSLPGAMNNGPMMPGQPMNRMRFIQPQAWNNSQPSYNPSQRMPQVGMDMSSRLAMGGKPDEAGLGQDMLGSGLGGGGGSGGGGGGGSQNYYTPHHTTSQSDHHYRGDIRDHRDIRDDRDHRDLRDDRDRRLDDRSSRQDERSLRHEDSRSLRPDDRSIKQEERSSSRRGDERSSRRNDDERTSSRREEGSSSSSRREERSSRREEKSSSSSSRREKSHRSDERVRSRSRERSRDRSRDRKERRDRRERY